MINIMLMSFTKIKGGKNEKEAVKMGGGEADLFWPPGRAGRM